MQLAKLIGDIAIGERPNDSPPPETPEAVAKTAARRKGGLKGGKARAKALSAKKRQEIAKKAASRRWSSR